MKKRGATITSSFPSTGRPASRSTTARSSATPLNRCWTRPYCLEVSSAGVSRLLRTDAHLQYAAERGLPVTASAYTPVFAGAKQYTGRIESFDAQTIRFADGPAVERKAVARLEAEC